MRHESVVASAAASVDRIVGGDRDRQPDDEADRCRSRSQRAAGARSSATSPRRSARAVPRTGSDRIGCQTSPTMLAAMEIDRRGNRRPARPGARTEEEASVLTGPSGYACHVRAARVTRRLGPCGLRGPQGRRRCGRHGQLGGPGSGSSASFTAARADPAPCRRTRRRRQRYAIGTFMITIRKTSTHQSPDMARSSRPGSRGRSPARFPRLGPRREWEHRCG